MSNRLEISADVTTRVAAELGLDWALVDADEFRLGLQLEVDRESRTLDTHVSQHALIPIGRLLSKRIEALPDYYTRLDRLDDEIDACYAHFSASATDRFLTCNTKQ